MMCNSYADAPLKGSAAVLPEVFDVVLYTSEKEAVCQGMVIDQGLSGGAPVNICVGIK
jgi:hypothetical protein